MLKVLRIGHRPARDKRVTTHVALVARAFGADEIIISTKDLEVERTIKSVVSRFGGRFEISSGVSWRQAFNTWSGLKVHLTMYGAPLEEAMPKLFGQDLLIIVGAEKVPADIYQMADFNVAITNQPHSEVAALALFLDRYFEGKELKHYFEGSRLTIIPNPRGKTVVDSSQESE